MTTITESERPTGASTGLTGLVRLWLRACALIPLLAYGLLLCLLVCLDAGGYLRREALAAHWSRLLIALLGIRVRFRGSVPDQPVLIVANHVSWLDIPVIQTHLPCRFVSKSEVRDWPIAGWFAQAAGTFYIRRGKGGSRPLLNRLIPHLQDRGVVTIFPEGTTSDGTQVLPFHSRLFAAAIESGCQVIPVSIQYGPGCDGQALAPFIGDDNLVAHLFRVLRDPGMDVSIMTSTPLDSEGKSRAQLAEASRQEIRQKLATG